MGIKPTLQHSYSYLFRIILAHFIIICKTNYDKILDICYGVKGAGQTLLKLGTININAAGVKLVIKNVKNVVKINQLLADLIREQTGKQMAVKRVKELRSEDQDLSPQDKEKITEDFLNQDELEEYDEYDLADLIEEYKDVFGELRLKKFLVDELEEYDEQEEAEDLAEHEETEEDEAEEISAKFQKKKL